MRLPRRESRTQRVYREATEAADALERALVGLPPGPVPDDLPELLDFRRKARAFREHAAREAGVA